MSDIGAMIRVRGLVQGVGFRPTLWRLAERHGLRGSVSNDGEGVRIHICGPAAAVEEFVLDLPAESPPLARIDRIEREPAACVPSDAGFRIAASEASRVSTGVAPDAATCTACLQEIFDPFARRYRYAFTNCTHCGPRLSILRHVPYDRATTSMAGFALCAACRSEYTDPADRRFHAEPIACHVCGPRLALARADGRAMILESLTALDAADAACSLLQRGHILAIQGMGGYQLACDATLPAAVRRLRELKGRPDKPFALMARDIDVIRVHAEVSAAEAGLLGSAAAPIVLLRRAAGGGTPHGGTPHDGTPHDGTPHDGTPHDGTPHDGTPHDGTPHDGSPRGKSPPTTALKPAAGVARPLAAEVARPLAPEVAPRSASFGFMLPNTPLHHLLLRRLGRPIVLTSGNRSDEPQAIERVDARLRLRGIAEYFLEHDRPIERRVDDSVACVAAGRARVIRRARGYAPAPLPLPPGLAGAPRILSYGGEFKNTFCLLRDGAAILSPHLGDLQDALTRADQRRALTDMCRFFEFEPEAIACDLHPDYSSAQAARAAAAERQLPLLESQHHHAHIAACLADNAVDWNAPPVLGVALDGLGFGADGTFWGGEFLLADYAGYRRLGSFKAVPLLGGEAAIREPWRNTYAHLLAGMGWASFAMNYADLDLYRCLEAKPRGLLDAMFSRGLNSPLASSCGRLFDGVAAALGFARERASYEGQGAVELEAAVDRACLDHEDERLNYPFAIPLRAGLPYLEPLAMWAALLGDLLLNTPVGIMAARFHRGLAAGIVRMVETLAAGLLPGEAVPRVALSGGVFQNRILFEQVLARLEKKGFDVLCHARVPCNDGGLALGQALIAASRLLRGLPPASNPCA
jgi:hydrogenase maturation protein HypF